MKAARRNVRRMVKAVQRRFRGLRNGNLVERLKDLEASHGSMAGDVAYLRAEVQMASMRQQALVDYYETRIDRIYARLSADLAGVSSVSVLVEQDSEIDDRLMNDFRKVLRTREDYITIPIADVLSDILQPGVIRAPLTLQGFRINRAVAREAGDRVSVAAVDSGRSPIALYGPYKKLRPGRYEVVLKVVFRAGKRRKNDPGVTFDIFCPPLDRVCASGATCAQGEGEEEALICLDLDWSAGDSAGELEFRVHQKSAREIDILGFEIRVHEVKIDG